MREAGWAIEADAASTQLCEAVPAHDLPTAAVRLERVPVRSLANHRAAWADLCARALEPNVFLQPGFALPLMQHVAPTRRPDVLVVWETTPALGVRMIGLLPVRCPRLALVHARGFHDKLAALGTPLLDRHRGAVAFTAMLEWLARRLPRPAALVLTEIPADGAFMRDVIGAHVVAGRVATLAAHDRAVLRRTDERDGNILSLKSAKTRKERNRQRRRLADHGTRAYVSARTPDAVARATESFLVLEHKGWKGDHGTALLADPFTATFARSMTRQMALDGACRIDALEIDGQAVAMGIVLTSGDHAYFWKTAFDENLAPLSPGVQLAIDLADVQLADAGVAVTDSCAMPNHPMIDKLWPDRLRILDLAIAIEPHAPASFRISVAIERSRRRLRSWLKRSAERLRRRRTPG